MGNSITGSMPGVLNTLNEALPAKVKLKKNGKKNSNFSTPFNFVKKREVFTIHLLSPLFQ